MKRKKRGEFHPKKHKISKIRLKGEKKSSLDRKIKLANAKLSQIKVEIKKAVVGQDKVIENLLVCILCNGSALLEGVPGIAKTLIINALATSINCNFKRVQFTADLLPTDITGFEAYSREKGFFTVRGPIFTNFVLADEINRAIF